MQVPVVGYRLENRTPPHLKFYTVLISDDGVVVTAWGRIGTRGQAKIEKFPNREAAESVGLRQFYAKQSKGYTAVHSGVKFVVEDKVIAQACTNDRPDLLTNKFGAALIDPQFEGDRKSVTQHYDDFVEKAQRLLSEASERSFDEVYAQFEELDAAWSAISDKHAEAEVTVGFLRATLQQRLMAGAL